MNRLLAAAAAAAAALALLACASASAQPVYRGKLEIRHADDFAHARGQTSWTLVRGHRRLPILPTAQVNARSGEHVTVRGRKVGGWLEGKVRTRPGGRIHAASALGLHNVAVVLVNFANDTRQPWTPAYVTQRIFTDSDSTAAFYNEESYGDVSVTGHVFGWYTIAATTGQCDVDGWASQARDAVTAAGDSLDGYDNVMFVFPQQSSCNWAGLGELPGSQTWLNGDISVRVAAHELGHNLGLHHASSYTCTRGGVPVTMSTSCSASEYGDPFDVMGLNPRHNNGFHLAELGVVRGANVSTVTASGSYTLRSAMTPGTGTDLLRIPTGSGSGHYYDLDIRTAGGVFENYLSNAAVVNGVSIHYDPSVGSRLQSMLLDATPGSSSGFVDSALTQGNTFSDGSISITASSVTPGAATVDVVLGATADTTAPSAPASFDARPVAGGTDLSWSPSSDNVGVAGYRVLRDDAVIASTPGTSWSDRNLAPGSTHKYQLVAYDAAGNAASSSLRFVTVPAAPVAPPGPGGSGDVLAPSVTLLSPAGDARLRGRARIAARASDDTGVVGMELYIDGRRAASVRAAGFTRTWNVRGVRPGTHTLRVRAYDAAGHAASRSVRVTVLASGSAARKARRSSRGH